VEAAPAGGFRLFSWGAAARTAEVSAEAASGDSEADSPAAGERAARGKAEKKTGEFMLTESKDL